MKTGFPLVTVVSEQTFILLELATAQCTYLVNNCACVFVTDMRNSVSDMAQGSWELQKTVKHRVIQNLTGELLIVTKRMLWVFRIRRHK